MNALVLYSYEGDRSQTRYHRLKQRASLDCLEQVKVHTTILQPSFILNYHQLAIQRLVVRGAKKSLLPT